MLRPPRLQRPRRAVHAALLAALIFLVGDIALGLALADTEARDGAMAMPERFGTPGPALGDAASYGYSRFVDRGDGREELETRGPPIGWEWIGEGQGLDADGQPVRYWTASFEEAGYDVLVDAASGRAFAHRDRFVHNDTNERGYGITPLTTTETDAFTAETIMFIDGADHSIPYCGLRHALQGQVLPTNGTVALLGPCYLPQYDGLLLESTDGFRAVRSERLGDHQAVVYELDPAPPPSQDNPLNGDTYSVSVWLSATVPYPLRIEWAQHADGRTFVEVLDLESFHRGDALLETSLPEATAAPALTLAPVQPWGIDDEGIDHPFPLSMAYQKAHDDPDFPALRDFLDDHPDAFTSSAGYAEATINGDVRRQWIVTVADATDHLEFCSTQTTETPLGSIGHFVPPAVRQPLPPTPYRYDTEECEWIGRPADPADAPTELPTAASLLARAQAYMDAYGIDGEVNAYLLDPCWEDDCATSPRLVRAGVHQYAATDHVEGELPTLSRDQAWHQAEIKVSLDGATERFEHSDQSDKSRLDAPAPATDPPEGSDPALQAVDAELIPHWKMPGPKTLAGMGTVALTAGVGYYLFPFAKSGVAGLFSRVQPAKAFDHPVRRRIEALLRNEPGLHLAALARRLDLSRRATRHHLQQLETAGLVLSRKGPRHACYFLDGSTDRRIMDAAPLLRSEGARAVLAAIVADPRASLSTIAQRTGLAVPTVHHHVRRLEAAGLVTRTRAGRATRQQVTSIGQAALDDAPTD